MSPGHQQQQQQLQHSPESPPPSSRALCLECLKKTSVRGVPRILAAKTVCLKTLWIVAVIAFFGVLLYNVVTLTLVFIRGDVIITQEPWTPRPAFPSLTICDTSPMTFSAMRRFNLTPRAYRRRILAMAKTAKALVPQQVLSQLLSPMAYHDHLELGALHDACREGPLVLPESCAVELHQDGVLVREPCLNVEKILVPGYFSCSQVTVAESAEAVTFHIVLDSEAGSLECNKCIPEHTESLSIGAILYLHERRSYPVVLDDALRIMPGTQNFMLVKSYRSTKRKKCSRVSPSEVAFKYSGNTIVSQYSVPLCEMLHRHDFYQQLCNCSVGALPHSMSDDTAAESHIPLCHVQEPSSGRESLSHLDRVDCVLQVDGRMPLRPAEREEKYRQLAGAQECLRPCLQIDFTVSRSEAKGIDKTSVLDIFDRYVRNTSMYSFLEDRLAVYMKAMKLRDSGRTAQAWELLRNTSYLEDNFMTVTLNFRAKQAKVMTENYILGLSAFISQIGGLLCLFSGVTVVCVAEAAELLWLLMTSLWDGRRWRLRAEATEAAPML